MKLYRDRDGVLRVDHSRRDDNGDLEVAFQSGQAQLVKRPGERARVVRTSTRFWVGAVEPDQGREP